MKCIRSIAEKGEATPRKLIERINHLKAISHQLGEYSDQSIKVVSPASGDIMRAVQMKLARIPEEGLGYASRENPSIASTSAADVRTTGTRGSEGLSCIRSQHGRCNISTNSIVPSLGPIPVQRVLTHRRSEYRCNRAVPGDLSDLLWKNQGRVLLFR